jgi:15-cis-phytoene synthase
LKSSTKEITKKSKSSFLYSFSILPKEKSDAINTIYAFCRMTDDIVDNNVLSTEEKSLQLNKWKEDFNTALLGDSDNELLKDVSSIIEKYEIPLKHFYDLIDGMRMDLEGRIYQTFEDLYQYCYKAASTVGLICIEIFGYKNDSAKDYAVNLGVALQLTNIIRDIQTDTALGRIYIPKNDLNQFNYSMEELKNNVYNQNFINLLSFEYERAESFYRKAEESLAEEDKKSMVAAVIMHKIYYRLLQKIKRNKFNIFGSSTRISKLRKILISLSVFLKYKLQYYVEEPDFAKLKV